MFYTNLIKRESKEEKGSIYSEEKNQYNKKQ